MIQVYKENFFKGEFIQGKILIQSDIRAISGLSYRSWLSLDPGLFLAISSIQVYKENFFKRIYSGRIYSRENLFKGEF
jgi:hypothetical protein